MNKLVIDLEELYKQHVEVSELNDQRGNDALSGLSEMLYSIIDLADEYKQEKKLTFVLVIE